MALQIVFAYKYLQIGYKSLVPSVQSQALLALICKRTRLDLVISLHVQIRDLYVYVIALPMPMPFGQGQGQGHQVQEDLHQPKN